MPRVTEQSHGGDVAADSRCRIGQTRMTLAGAEGITTIASQDVTENGGTLAVAAQHDGCVGALGVVCIDLLQRKNLAVSDRWAVIGGVGIICDVLVITGLARKIGTNTGGEIALTAGGKKKKSCACVWVCACAYVRGGVRRTGRTRKDEEEEKKEKKEKKEGKLFSFGQNTFFFCSLPAH